MLNQCHSYGFVTIISQALSPQCEVSYMNYTLPTISFDDLIFFKAFITHITSNSLLHQVFLGVSLPFSIKTCFIPSTLLTRALH